MDKQRNTTRDEEQVIRCPICGQEYLPAEIFFAEDLLGKPTHIVRTPDGKIDFYFGEEPNYTEQYCCDNCLTPLEIKAKLNFVVEVDEDKNLDKEYVSELRKNPIELEEVNLFNDENSAEEE